MVRLETIMPLVPVNVNNTFTFQYGQIRNYRIALYFDISVTIYIPVWLDQKLNVVFIQAPLMPNLHSSMVRLETF